MTRRAPTPRPAPPEPLVLKKPAHWMDYLMYGLVAAAAMLLIIAVIIATAAGCHPTPIPTPTPCLDATRVAVVSERIGVLETALPPIGTAVANCLQPTPTYMPIATSSPTWAPTTTIRPTWTPAVTPTPLAECRPCRVASECPAGQTCANCRGVAHFCVPIDSINGGCADCLVQMFALMMHSYQGPPEEEIDLDALSQDSKERRSGP